MMITEQQQPARRAATAGAASPPAWLKLEQGETLLASYPGKQLAERVIYATLAAVGQCCVVAVVTLAAGKAGRDLTGILTSIGGSGSGLVFTLGQLRSTRLHVTDKMLVFAEGRKAAGVPLADVSAIKRGDGSRWTIGVYVQRRPTPVGKITVLNTERVAAELAEYCRRGGASQLAAATVGGVNR
jgi:hypothetical protein